MSLISLRTNLKSLKFGHDRVDGGSSNQPYITSPIPDQIGTFGFLNQDFILRGGSKAVTDSATDVVRLGKYFTDTKSPSGVLFIAKQNLLSRTAVRTQASGLLLNEGVYTPLSTLVEAGGVAFGIHVNKQGLNPFGGTGGLTTYTDIVKSSQPISTNRLIGLLDNTTNNTATSNFGFLEGFNLNIGVGDVNLISYTGGPGAPLGIGKTYIKFADQRTLYTDKVTNPLSRNAGVNILVYTNQQLENISEDVSSTGDSFYIGHGATTTVGDFRKILRSKDIGELGLAPDSPNYTKKNIEQRVNLGNPGDRNGKKLTNYTNGGYGGAASPSSFDKINASILYQDEAVNQSSDVNDLVKFRIGVISNDKPTLKTYLHFRAFLNNITDTYTSDWASTKYIGRGENLYNYNGFDRKVSLSWTVAAQSKIELIPMYKKLNYLASICAPDYSSNGFMRGNIITLTVGGYFYEQPGIITGLSYDMNSEDATWEIGINDEGGSDSLVKELPHLIKVSGFNFIPIHTFVPRLQQNGYTKDSTLLNDYTVYGAERYIALANGTDAISTNYTSEQDKFIILNNS